MIWLYYSKLPRFSQFGLEVVSNTPKCITGSATHTTLAPPLDSVAFLHRRCWGQTIRGEILSSCPAFCLFKGLTINGNMTLDVMESFLEVLLEWLVLIMSPLARCCITSPDIQLMLNEIWWHSKRSSSRLGLPLFPFMQDAPHIWRMTKVSATHSQDNSTCHSLLPTSLFHTLQFASPSTWPAFYVTMTTPRVSLDNWWEGGLHCRHSSFEKWLVSLSYATVEAFSTRLGCKHHFRHARRHSRAQLMFRLVFISF